jgi:metal-dependent amidase/aminoacylase/carboxypeptidase family protein
MGTAEILASIKSELKGTVKFIQPAEVLLKAKKENKLMVEEGVLNNNPKVDVIFRHIMLRQKLVK